MLYYISPLYMKYIFYRLTLMRSKKLKYNIEVLKLNLLNYVWEKMFACSGPVFME